MFVRERVGLEVGFGRRGRFLFIIYGRDLGCYIG